MDTKLPPLRLHKHTDRAYVVLSGKRIYLGKWDAPDRDTKYQAAVAAWLRNGRPCHDDAKPILPADFLVADLCERYLAFARTYYVRVDGKTPSTQIGRVRSALRGLVLRYADIPASEFGPKKLAEVRDLWITEGLCRSTINSMIGCIKLMFKWGAAQELIPAATWQSLSALAGLRAGRSDAKEPKPVAPVPEAHIEAVKPYVSRQIRAMIELQLLTGARSGEICMLRNGGFDRAGKVWVYRLAHHKEAHIGKSRTLYFGARAQAILREFIAERPIGAPLFSPRAAETERHARCEGHRRPDQKPSPARTNRKLGDAYTPNTLATAIRRACILANVPKWHPHQLRHTAATKIRREFGLEAAQVILGHSKADTTQLYAERNEALARTIAEKVG